MVESRHGRMIQVARTTARHSSRSSESNIRSLSFFFKWAPRKRILEIFFEPGSAVRPFIWTALAAMAADFDAESMCLQLKIRSKWLQPVSIDTWR